MVRIAKRERSEQDEFQQKVAAFLRLKKSVAELTKEANGLRDEISASVDETGEVDESGNRWFHLADEVEGVASLKRERRASRSLDAAAAEAILSEKKLTERCYDLVPVLNEDSVMECVINGDLTEDDLEQMFPTKVAWALVTSKK